MKESPKETATLETETESLALRAQRLTIRNDIERTAAIEFLKTVKEWRKRIVDFFAPSKTAAHETWKTIVEQERGFTEKADSAEAIAKNLVLNYDREQSEIRRKEQARLQAEADAKAAAERAAIEAKAAKARTEEKRIALQAQAAAVVAPVQIVAPVARTGNDQTRATWKARVVNPDALPRLYLVPDLASLDEIARQTKGAEKIPGVEFYKVESLAIR